MKTYQNIEEYFAEIDIPEYMKKEYCQYYNGERYYCDATTHTTCRKCRFFTPTIYGKMEIIAKAYTEIKSRNEILKKKQVEQEKVIKWLRECIRRSEDEDYDAEY